MSLMRSIKTSCLPLAGWILLCASQLHGQIRVDDRVPADMKAAIGINVDVANIMSNELVAELVEMAPFGGPPFKISDLSRISALIAAPKGLDEESLASANYYVYLGFQDPALVKKVRESTIGNGGQEVTVGGKNLVRPNEFDFPPGTLMEFRQSAIVIATEPYMTMPSNQFATQGLVDAFASLPKHPVRMVVDMDAERPMLDQLHAMADANADFMTKPYVSLIKEVSHLSLSSDLNADTLLRLNLTGHNAEEAGEIKKKLDALIGLAQGAAAMIPPGSPEEAMSKELLGSLKAEVQGNSAIVNLPKPAGFDQALAQAVAQAKIAGLKMQDRNNFKQTLLGLLNYHDTRRQFPFAANAAAEDANSGLSWKVMVLPYIEQANMFDQFDMDSSYDSTQNAALGKMVVPVFQLNTGGTISWVRPENVPKNMAAILDGLSNTICLVQDRQTTTDPWTKPASISPDEVVAQFKALQPGESMIVGLYDGSVRTLNPGYNVDNLKAMLGPDDGIAIQEQGFGAPAGNDPFGSPESEKGAGPGFSKADEDPFGKKGGDDPFGKKGDDDPFGKGNEDPFGKKADDDPFGKKGGDDPFGKKSDDDPFGKGNEDPFGKSDDDPFGK